MTRDRSLATILILGGTQDARELTIALCASDVARRMRVISSLAGRTASPLIPPGEVRVGGFGGVDGLITYLQRESVAAVVDATHPFAAQMSANAATACALTRVPLARVERPAWRARAGDRFIAVANIDAAASRAAEVGRRIFVTVGRRDLAPFARLVDRFVLVRSIEAPDSELLPRDGAVVLSRGPFAFDDELALLRTYAIDCIVAKNSGGDATSAKLDAARALGIPVVMITRPETDPATPVCGDVVSAAAWIRTTLRARAGATLLGAP